MPDSLVTRPPPPATVDCGPAIQRAKSSATDPRVAAQARFLVWRMGVQTGVAAGMADLSIGLATPTDSAPLLAQQPRQIAGLLGVEPPTLPAARHAASALEEFKVFVAQGAACVAPQLAGKYSPRDSALFKYSLIVGHAAVYWINGPDMDPIFVSEIRQYGAQAGVPLQLSQPFIDKKADSLAGSGIGEKVQSALNRIDEFVKANP